MRQVLSIIIVVIIIIPMTGQSQDNPEPTIIKPSKVDDDHIVTNHTLHQGWTHHQLTQVLSGKGYYQLISMTISDNLTNPFGTDQYYRIKLNLDLMGTMFDPDPIEVIIEDGERKTIPVDLQLDQNHMLNLTYDILSINNNTVHVEVDTTIENYLVPTNQYQLGQQSYTLLTEPTRSVFNSTGSSFSWSKLPNTFILLDPNLITGQEYEIQITVEIQVTSYLEDNDRIRMEVGGDADTGQVVDVKSLSVSSSIASMMDISFSVLGELIEFTITDIIIDIGEDIYDKEFELPEQLPPFGILVASFFFILALVVVIAYMKVKLRMQEDD